MNNYNPDILVDAIINSGNEVHLTEDNQWVDGMYIRTLDIPKGIVVVGHKHKKNTINFLTRGLVYYAEGDTFLRAPHMFISNPGDMKTLIAYEDSTFVNIIRTDKTTIEETYEDVVYPDKRAIIYHQYKALEGGL